MSTAATPVPLSEAKARLSELARRVRQQHERITLTRNGEPEAVLLSVDDLEGLEMTLEVLGDAAARIRRAWPPSGVMSLALTWRQQSPISALCRHHKPCGSRAWHGA
jgi:prevent-host-death family protein